MLSEALWGLAAAGGTAMAGAAATDVWRSARLRFAGLLDRAGPARDPAGPERTEPGNPGRVPDGAGARAAEPGAGPRPPARRTCLQHNWAHRGGTQYITMTGDVIIDRDGRGRR